MTHPHKMEGNIDVQTECVGTKQNRKWLDLEWPDPLNCGGLKKSLVLACALTKGGGNILMKLWLWGGRHRLIEQYSNRYVFVWR